MLLFDFLLHAELSTHLAELEPLEVYSQTLQYCALNNSSPCRKKTVQVCCSSCRCRDVDAVALITLITQHADNDDHDDFKSSLFRTSINQLLIEDYFTRKCID